MRLAFLGLLLCGCTVAPVASSAPVSRPASGWDVEPVSGLGLFADEDARGQELVFAELSTRDAGVVPLEVTRRAWKLAREGKNPLTGAECGKPLYPFQARQRWGLALGVTGTFASYASCERDGGCELKVYGRPLKEEEGPGGELAAPLAREGNAMTALASAVSRLAPPPTSEGGGSDLLGGLAGSSSPVRTEDRLVVRAWPADARARNQGNDEQAPFPTLTLQHVQTCTDDSALLLIEVAANGALTRCEGEEPEAPCACGQLQRLAPASWLSGQRWSVSVRIEHKDQLTSDGKLVLSAYWNTYLQRVDVPGQKYPHYEPKVEDPSISAWSTGSHRLATDCFANSFSSPGSINSRWAVWFDGVGRPTKVVEQKGFALLPKETAACVKRALMLAQAPCPSRAGLWAMANLSVTARDPSAPPKGLNDLLSP